MRFAVAPISYRVFSTSLASPSSSSQWSQSPSPPRLPKEEQEIFEKLLRQNAAAGAFATPKEEEAPQQQEDAIVKVEDGDELHPHTRRGAAPEFEGERNPQTGETGGPKNDPFRGGKDREWSYNGRVTDF